MSAVRFDFRGKHVLVTGASRGIGFAVARGFAAAGARLSLLADDPAVEDAAFRLEQALGGRVQGVLCDIADNARVHETIAALPPVNVLINNAGLERLTPVDESGSEVDALFQRLINVNVVGTFSVTQAVLRKMPAGGRIVNTSSIWGKAAEPGFAAYVASKHAILGMTRTLAKELGPRAIGVNAVCPGWVRTEASMRSLETMAARANCAQEDLLAAITGAQAMPGLMDVDDVVSTYLFLASDAAKNITGQALNVDRGELMS